MKLSLTIASIIVLLFGVLSDAPLARAISEIDVPNFPSCTSPTGTLKVSYSSGVHGIVGDQGQYVGSDSVYTLNDSNLIQCFCSTAGQGIQTNWWKIDSLSESQIDSLQKLGWIYIPSGLPWGLSDGAYMAHNTVYSCLSGGGNGGNNNGGGGSGSAPVCDSKQPNAPTLISVVRSGSQAVLTWTAVQNATHYSISYGTTPGVYLYGVANTGNVTKFTIGSLNPAQTYYFSIRAVNNCMPSDPSTPTTPQITGQVLGLATTGNSTQIYLTFGLGLLFLATSIAVSRRKHA